MSSLLLIPHTAAHRVTSHASWPGMQSPGRGTLSARTKEVSDKPGQVGHPSKGWCKASSCHLPGQRPEKNWIPEGVVFNIVQASIPNGREPAPRHPPFLQARRSAEEFTPLPLSAATSTLASLPIHTSLLLPGRQCFLSPPRYMALLSL